MTKILLKKIRCTNDATADKLRLLAFMMQLCTEAEFQLHFERFLKATACKNIGDSATYMKHLNRERQNGNVGACTTLEALAFFQAWQDQVSMYLKQLTVAGQMRIVGIFDAVAKTSSLPFSFLQKWHLCGVTGMPSTRLIWLDNEIVADASFEPVFVAYWLVLHIHEIEHLRILEFLQQQDEETCIKMLLHAYMKELATETEQIGKLYFWAFDLILRVLHNTIQHLDSFFTTMQQEVQEGARDKVK